MALNDLFSHAEHAARTAGHYAKAAVETIQDSLKAPAAAPTAKAQTGTVLRVGRMTEMGVDNGEGQLHTVLILVIEGYPSLVRVAETAQTCLIQAGDQVEIRPGASGVSVTNLTLDQLRGR